MNNPVKFLRTVDPAQLNLLNGLRGALSVTTSYLICSNFSLIIGFLGGLFAMLASILVVEPSQKQQMKTYGLMIPVCMLSLSSSIALSAFHNLQLSIFLVFIFGAIYLRKFGLRWLTLGMMGFMSYFTPLFFPLPPKLLPQALLSVLVGIACSFVLKFILIRERPEKVLKKYLKAYNALYEDLIRCQEANKVQALQKINEMTLIIENYVSTGDSRPLRSKTEALQLALFERELSLRFEGKVHHSPITLDELTEKEIEDQVQVSKAPQGLPITTRIAVQATISAALASVFGIMISPTRWYWAPLTSFVIMVGSTRGEILLRSTYRVTGTVIGLLLGSAFVLAVKGMSTLEWSLIVFCIFSGIFAMRFLFGFWTATVFTFMLVILFEVLGQLNDSILLVRFEETLLGAFLSTVISALILPVSTKKVVREALALVLESQVEVLNHLPLTKGDYLSMKKFILSVRKMDRETQALKTASAPYLGGVLLMKRTKMISYVHDVTAIGHYIRHLGNLEGKALEELTEEMLLMAKKFRETQEDDETMNRLLKKLMKL